MGTSPFCGGCGKRRISRAHGIPRSFCCSTTEAQVRPYGKNAPLIDASVIAYIHTSMAAAAAAAAGGGAAAAAAAAEEYAL